MLRALPTSCYHRNHNQHFLTNQVEELKALLVLKTTDLATQWAGGCSGPGRSSFFCTSVYHLQTFNLLPLLVPLTETAAWLNTPTHFSPHDEDDIKTGVFQQGRISSLCHRHALFLSRLFRCWTCGGGTAGRKEESEREKKPPWNQICLTRSDSEDVRKEKRKKQTVIKVR